MTRLCPVARKTVWGEFLHCSLPEDHFGDHLCLLSMEEWVEEHSRRRREGV